MTVFGKHLTTSQRLLISTDDRPISILPRTAGLRVRLQYHVATSTTLLVCPNNYSRLPHNPYPFGTSREMGSSKIWCGNDTNHEQGKALRECEIFRPFKLM